MNDQKQQGQQQPPDNNDNSELPEQLQEHNFDLQATIVTLEAEKQHALNALQQEAAKKESKLKAELRLALQDAQRWKAMAQGRPKSIAGTSHEVTLPMVDERKLPAAAPPPLTAPTGKRPREEENAMDMEEMEEETETADPSKLPPQPTSTTSVHPTSRLALNLLTQTQPIVPEDSTDEGGNNTSTATVSISAEASNREASIRQVLMSIASSRHDDSTPTWSEEALIEWLIRQSTMAMDNSISQLSPDRYYMVALILSPKCRKHVVQTIVAAHADEKEDEEGESKRQGESKMEIDIEETNKAKEGQDDSQNEERAESAPQPHIPPRRPRKSRIQVLAPNSEEIMEELEALRESMRDPFWTPNTVTIKKAPPGVASSELLQDFVRGLSRSMKPEHLQTLQNILDQAAASHAMDYDGSLRNGIWWELCYDGLSTTIQRLSLYRILHSPEFLHNVNGIKKQEPEETPAQQTNSWRFQRKTSNPTRRPSSASGNKAQGRRCRLDKLKERLKCLTPDLADVNALPVSTHEQSLSTALSTLASLLRVTQNKKLQKWYSDLAGLEFDANNLSFGGMAMVALLLELLEDVMFRHWKHELSAMHPDRIYSPDKNKGKWSPLAVAIPQWYHAIIVVMQRIGRTWGGMELLRTRAADSTLDDWMGNTLDVSIRHLMKLALHWDDVRLQEGAILRFDDDDDENDESGNENSRKEKEKGPKYWREERNAIIIAAEAWVRLWHQVLMMVQQSGGYGTPITFRSLVEDLKEYYNSACAMLVASDDTRPEIKAMIRWQQEELSLDEEEYEEWKEEQIRQSKKNHEKAAEETGGAEKEDKSDGDQEMVL